MTKLFLDAELAKYKTWEEAKKSVFYNGLFKGETNPVARFEQLKSKGIGSETITDFLGVNGKQTILLQYN